MFKQINEVVDRFNCMEYKDRLSFNRFIYLEVRSRTMMKQVAFAYNFDRFAFGREKVIQAILRVPAEAIAAFMTAEICGFDVDNGAAVIVEGTSAVVVCFLEGMMLYGVFRMNEDRCIEFKEADIQRAFFDNDRNGKTLVESMISDDDLIDMLKQA
jgi:hypothetical protein